MVGNRDAVAAYEFMKDLQGRLANRVRLTGGGLRVYVDAVAATIGADIDFAQLVKIYGESPEQEERRYSPAECKGAKKTKVTSQRSSRTTLRRSPYTSCTTTSLGFARRFGSGLRWRQASPAGVGDQRISSG